MGDEHNSLRSSSSCADRGGTNESCKLSSILAVRVESLETQVSSMNHAITQMTISNERIGSNITTIGESDKHHGIALDNLSLRISRLEDNNNKVILDLKDLQNGLALSTDRYVTTTGHIKKLAKSFIDLEKTFKALELCNTTTTNKYDNLVSKVSDIMEEMDEYPDASMIVSEHAVMKEKIKTLEDLSGKLEDENIALKATINTTRNIAIAIGALATFISMIISIINP